MHAAMDFARLGADVLHDVDFAARRPPDFIDVVPERPECRPDALALRGLNARLEASIGLCEARGGLKTSRRVVATHAIRAGERLFQHRDDEVPVLPCRVL